MIAALLLSTYTAGKIKRIPLDLSATLISNGTGTALDPASLSARDRFVIDRNVPLVAQQQLSVESPANADVVTLPVGSTVRRTDRQQGMGLLLAMVDTVTLDRTTALAVSDDTHPGGYVQKPRTIEDDKPPTNIALPHEGLAYRFPFDTEKKTYPYFDPIAQKPFDANYDGEEDVNGLTTYRFTQNAGHDADGKLVEPVQLNDIPAVTETTYDAAERPLVALLREYGYEKSRTTTAYTGDQVKVTPPAGGTPTTTTTIVDEDTGNGGVPPDDGSLDTTEDLTDTPASTTPASSVAPSTTTTTVAVVHEQSATTATTATTAAVTP